MPTNKYQNCKKILATLPAIYTLGKLQQAIMEQVGADGRTLKSYTDLMLKTKLMKDVGAFRFEKTC